MKNPQKKIARHFPELLPSPNLPDSPLVNNDCSLTLWCWMAQQVVVQKGCIITESIADPSVCDQLCVHTRAFLLLSLEMAFLGKEPYINALFFYHIYVSFNVLT